MSEFENKVANEETETQKPEPKTKAPAPESAETEDFALQLAKANAELARYKNSIDKLTKENKTLNDWKKERMSAEEQKAEADAEAAERQKEYIKSLEDYKAVNEASKRYLSMGMDVDLALATATAENNGDMDTVMKNIKANTEAQLTAAKEEWLNSRPDIRTGGEPQTEEEQLREVFMANL